MQTNQWIGRVFLVPRPARKTRRQAGWRFQRADRTPLAEPAVAVPGRECPSYAIGRRAWPVESMAMWLAAWRSGLGDARTGGRSVRRELAEWQ